MARIRCEIVTAERTVFEDEVDMVVAPGIEGQLGILPNHAPLVTSLTYGELILHREGREDEFIAIGGGFLEVGPPKRIQGATWNRRPLLLTHRGQSLFSGKLPTERGSLTVKPAEKSVTIPLE